jgi:hypothetical protein
MMEECSICLEEIPKNQEYYVMCSCNYVYHEKCINQWRDKKNVCPICWKSLYIPDIDDRIDLYLGSLLNCIKTIIAKIM